MNRIHALSVVMKQTTKLNILYHIDLFSDRQVKANSIDTDQTAPEESVLSRSMLFAILYAPFGCIQYFMVKSS